MKSFQFAQKGENENPARAIYQPKSAIKQNTKNSMNSKSVAHGKKGASKAKQHCKENQASLVKEKKVSIYVI